MVRWIGIAVGGLLVGSALPGCGTDPDNVLTGAWGNERTLLVATVDSVRIRFACGRIAADGPIHVEADGAFSIAGEYNGGVNFPHGPVQLAGQRIGARLSLEITGTTDDLPSDHLDLRAGVMPDFSDVSCLQ